MSSGLRAFYRSPLKRSSDISWFDHVQFACASTQSKFEPRFCEEKSLSSIMPSVSKVMKVTHSPCQEWGLKVISQWYDFLSSKPSDVASVPLSVGNAAVMESTLWSTLGSYIWRLRPDSPGAVALVATWRGVFSSVTWCLPSRRLRSAICCLPPGGFICACHSWRSSTCRKGCVLLSRITV